MKRNLPLVCIALLAPGAFVSSLQAAQPLPQGKARFTVTCGNLDYNGYSWVRIMNWTFNTNGTVAASAWTWDSDNKVGKTAFNSHRCTFDGVTKTCTTYTPTGWVYPVSQHQNWAGTYVYNTSTGRLDITWTSPHAGAADSWTVTLPQTGLARVSLLSSTYTLTHGRGYGSNAAWSTFKTISQIPRVTYADTTGKCAVASYYSGTLTISPSTTGWKKAGMDLSGFTTPSSPTPPNCLHAWLPSDACNPGLCATTRSGIVYHLASENTNRQIAYTNFCACLAHETSWPCYSGNLHPSAFMQIIDDSGALAGYVGIEAQNPPSGQSGYPNYQLTLWDFSQIP